MSEAQTTDHDEIGQWAETLYSSKYGRSTCGWLYHSVFVVILALLIARRARVTERAPAEADAQKL